MARRTKSQRRLANERGIALAVVLLILVIVLLLGTTLIGVSVTEDQAGSIRADMKKAFFAAEAGIQEAMYRMRLDPNSFPNESSTPYSVTADPLVVGSVQGTSPNASFTVLSLSSGISNIWKYNPSWAYLGSNTTKYGNYFGKNPANLDSAGRTFTSSGLAHVGGPLASANLANGGSYTVTVAPVVGYVGVCWQYVDQFGTPLPLAGSAVACAAGAIPVNPIYKVTSTGTARNSQKVLSAMIRRINTNPNPDASLTANTSVDVKSAKALIDGNNYDCNGNNPSGTNSVKAATVPSGDTITTNKNKNLQCSPNKQGVKDCGGTSSAFPSSIGELLLRGSSPTQSQIDALNAYLESIKIDPIAHPEKLPTSAFHGILYVDGNYTQPPDGSTGILIVHHRNPYGQSGCSNPGGCDVANLGNFNGGTFKGLIVTDTINKINGNAQIIGAIFALGSATTVGDINDVTGTPEILYSKCVVDGLSKNFPFQIVSGTWHEQ